MASRPVVQLVQTFFSSPSLLRPYPRLPRLLPRITVARLAHNIPRPPPRQIPESSTSSAPETTPSPSENKSRKLSEPHYELTFTCIPCGARSTHTISKQGYHKGSVLITCPDCRNRHVISDNLNIFGDRKINVEDLMRERGRLVKRGTVGEDGDLEFWEDGTVTDRGGARDTESSANGSDGVSAEEVEASRMREMRDPTSQSTAPAASPLASSGARPTVGRTKMDPNDSSVPSTRRQYSTRPTPVRNRKNSEREFQPRNVVRENGHLRLEIARLRIENARLRGKLAEAAVTAVTSTLPEKAATVSDNDDWGLRSFRRTHVPFLRSTQTNNILPYNEAEDKTKKTMLNRLSLRDHFSQHTLLAESRRQIVILPQHLTPEKQQQQQQQRLVRYQAVDNRAGLSSPMTPAMTERLTRKIEAALAEDHGATASNDGQAIGKGGDSRRAALDEIERRRRYQQRRKEILDDIMSDSVRNLVAASEAKKEEREGTLA